MRTDKIALVGLKCGGQFVAGRGLAGAPVREATIAPVPQGPLLPLRFAQTSRPPKSDISDYSARGNFPGNKVPILGKLNTRSRMSASGLRIRSMRIMAFRPPLP